MLSLKVPEWKLAQQIGATHYIESGVKYVEFFKKEGSHWYSWLVFRGRRSDHSDTEWNLAGDDSSVEIKDMLLIPTKEAYQHELFDYIVGSLNKEMSQLGVTRYLSVSDLLVSGALGVIARSLEVD